MKRKRESESLEKKLRAAHEWLYEIDKTIESVNVMAKGPSFNPAAWDNVAYMIKLARLRLGRAQSHARRLARVGLAKKGLR